MLKTLLKQIKQYRKASVLAAVFTVLEVILELIILMLMASVIDNGIESGNINNVYVYGLCIEKNLSTIIQQFEEMKKDLVFLLSENGDQQN